VLVAVWATPSWAGPNKASPPGDPALYGNFMRAAVARYGDRVSAWELWCEPDLRKYWNGSPSQYRHQVLEPGFDAVKAVRPSAKVVGPAIIWGQFQPDSPASFAPYLVGEDGQLTRKIDVLGFHLFVPEGSVKKLLQNADSFAARYGIPEVWLTSF